MKFGFDRRQVVSEKKMLEKVHVHVYSPREGVDNPLGPNIKNINHVNLIFYLLNYIVTVFIFHSNAYVSKFYLTVKQVAQKATIAHL